MSESRPEHWSIDAGEADVAMLHVPPAEGRVRRFEVDVRFVVRCPADAAGAWHEITIELDGRRHWQRRIPTSNPGDTDSLDFHCRVDVPDGAPLRIRALTRVRGSVRRQLRIDAEES